MHSHGNDGTDHLDDSELLAREALQRDEFKRLEEREQFRDTTYGIPRGSAALVESWDRWLRTNVAARLRGLLTRGMGA